MIESSFQAHLRRAVLGVIRVGRSLFYNTWVQRLAITDRIYRRLFYSLYRNQPETVVNFQGLRFHVDTSDITIVPSLLNETYEAAELAVFRRLVAPGMGILDLGANIGLYSLIGAKTVGPSGRVFAFEPEPRNIELLRRNIAENGLANVDVFETAVGETAGTLRLFLADGSLGTHSAGAVGSRHIDVIINRIDDALAHVDRSIDFVKMDIEGYEPAALRGMQRILEKYQPTLMVEFNPTSLTNCGFAPSLFFDDIAVRFRNIYVVRHGALRSLSTTERSHIRSSGKAVNLFATNRSIPAAG